MRHTDIIQLDRNFLPKDRVRWDIRCCYASLALLLIGSHYLAFVGGFFYCHHQGSECTLF